MADEALSSLDPATLPLAGTELTYIVQGGNSRRATVADQWPDAIDVPFDNTLSGLASSDVQGALDELVGLTGGFGGFATTTEFLTGTLTTKATTPDSVAALWEKGSNIASAGTITIGEGGFFHVTGTTTITDIDWSVAKDGRAAILVFDGALTLTHHATTLKLPTAANIVTVAGDVGVFVQDSSDNVICVFYQRADGTALAASGGAAGAFHIEGSIDASTNPNYPAASAGDVYVFSNAGKIGGASGPNVEVGDYIICIADNAGGTHASVGSSWVITQGNIDGAVLNTRTISTTNGITGGGNLSADRTLELTTNARTGGVEVVIDGGGATITTGIKGDVRVPYAGTITKVTLLADATGSIVIDIWKDTYANYPPLVADSITASAKPTLSSAVKSENSTLTGWTTAVSAGDILRFNVDSAATVTRVALILEMLRT